MIQVRHNPHTGASPDPRLRTAALAAGLGYLVVFLLTPYSWVQGLIIWGDATTTVNNLRGSESLFRFGIACWGVVLVADTVVAWGLYYVFTEANRSLALLASIFRILFVAIFAANLFNWANALQLVVVSDVAGFGGVAVEAQTMLFLGAYEYGTNIAFLFFGAHISIIGYLIYRTGVAPRIVGVLLMLASVGYFIDSFASIISQGYAANELAFWLVVAAPAVLAEFSLTVWLLVRGGKA